MVEDPNSQLSHSVQAGEEVLMRLRDKCCIGTPVQHLRKDSDPSESLPQARQGGHARISLEEFVKPS